MDSSLSEYLIEPPATVSGHRTAVLKILQRDDAIRGGLMHRMAREWLETASSDSDPLRLIEQVPGNFWEVAPWGRFHPEPIEGGCKSFLNKAPSEKPDWGERTFQVPLIEIRGVIRVKSQ